MRCGGQVVYCEDRHQGALLCLGGGGYTEPVSPRPLHLHRISSLGSNVGCTRFETACAPGAQPPIGSTWHLGSASEPRPPVGCSPRVRPFPPRPPPEVAFLCSVAPRYYGLIRLLIRVHARRAAIAFPSRPGQVRARVRPPRFRTKNFSTCTRSPTARGSSHASQYAMEDVAFSSAVRDRHLGIRPVTVESLEPHAYVQTTSTDYLLTLLSRGMSAAGRAGEIGQTMVESFNAEARR